MSKQIVLVQEEPRGPSQLVEIPVTAGQTRTPLPDIQQLRSQNGQTIIIKAIRLITPKIATTGPTSGLANATITELRKQFLTLYSEGWEKGMLIPMLTLNDTQDNDSAAATTIQGVRSLQRFDDWSNVDWSKSFIQFANGTAAVGSYVVMLDVQYIKLDGNGKPIIGPS